MHTNSVSADPQKVPGNLHDSFRNPEVWEVPEPDSVLDVRLDGGTRTILRRHGNPEGPRLVLSHGNGLAIDLYYPFWSLLETDFDLLLYDLRNHGWNTVGPQSAHNLPTMVRDHDLILEAIDSHFGPKPKIGIFHSLSALTTLLSLEGSRGYAGRVLFDPPVCKAGRSELQFEAAAELAAAVTRRRTDRFESEADYVDVIRMAPAFSRVVPGVHELMARTTLRQAPEGGPFELRCPKEYEAQIIDYARAFAATLDLETLPCPTKVVGADPTVPFSYLPTFDMTHVLAVDYDFIPETTHFLQLENPEACAAASRDFIKLQCLF